MLKNYRSFAANLAYVFLACTAITLPESVLFKYFSISVSIILFHPLLGLPSGVFLSRFKTNFYCGASAHSGPGPPHYRGFTITLRRTTLGRTPLDEWSARRTETSAWQNSTLTTDRHSCPRWDSNPQSQQASSHKHTRKLQLLMNSSLLLSPLHGLSISFVLIRSKK